MRVYEPYTKFNPDYPEDFEKIKSYLGDRGKINVNDATLEEFYYDFSDDNFSARWMSVNTILGEGTEDECSILEYFAEWLSKKEI